MWPRTQTFWPHYTRIGLIVGHDFKTGHMSNKHGPILTVRSAFDTVYRDQTSLPYFLGVKLSGTFLPTFVGDYFVWESFAIGDSFIWDCFVQEYFAIGVCFVRTRVQECLVSNKITSVLMIKFQLSKPPKSNLSNVPHTFNTILFQL